MAARMNPPRSPERRRAQRVAQRVTLSIVNPREVIKAETRDLSASGVYCFLSKFVPLMSKLELHFTLPGVPHAIHCTGVIVRVEPPSEQLGCDSYEAAIFFSDLSETDRRGIESFVQSRLTSTGKELS
jgi:hypothetical protein